MRAISRATLALRLAGSGAWGVGPDETKALAKILVRKIGKFDAVREPVGERRVDAAGLRELGVEFDRVADVDHYQKRRAAFFSRQMAGVLLGLAAGAEHRIVVAARAADAMAGAAAVARGVIPRNN